MFMSSSGSFTWRKAWRTVSAPSTAVVTDVSPPGEPSDLEYYGAGRAAGARSVSKSAGRAGAHRGSGIVARANASREKAGAARAWHPPLDTRGRPVARDAWRPRAPAAQSQSALRQPSPGTEQSGEHVPDPTAVTAPLPADRCRTRRRRSASDLPD